MAEDVDIAIIGGGLSGLALAARLAAAGRDFLLLEARPRLGGRIFSPAVGAADLAADLGPGWIWPGQRRVAALARDLGVRTFGQYSIGRLVFEEADGGVRRDLEFALNPEARRFVGGAAALTSALVDRLPAARIAADARVRRLERIGTGWGLEAAEREIVALRIVLALPPRLIADLIVEPALPSGARAALLRTPTWMASQAKAVATYKRPFWRAAGFSGDAISHRGPLAQIHDASPADASVGALIGFVGAPSAMRAQAGPEALKEAAAEQLGRLFGAEAGAPDEIRIQDWARERFTAAATDLDGPQGAPSGGLPPALAALAEDGLAIVSTETAPEAPGLLEGALAAADAAADALPAPRPACVGR